MKKFNNYYGEKEEKERIYKYTALVIVVALLVIGSKFPLAGALILSTIFYILFKLFA